MIRCRLCWNCASLVCACPRPAAARCSRSVSVRLRLASRGGAENAAADRTTRRWSCSTCALRSAVARAFAVTSTMRDTSVALPTWPCSMGSAATRRYSSCLGAARSVRPLPLHDRLKLGDRVPASHLARHRYSFRCATPKAEPSRAETHDHQQTINIHSARFVVLRDGCNFLARVFALGSTRSIRYHPRGFSRGGARQVAYTW